uniref:Uncharacterized protein n=1 Tax=Rhizophora mucronata TaxID=61149 RepID=A0A2P2JTH0_RHIMU
MNRESKIFTIFHKLLTSCRKGGKIPCQGTREDPSFASYSLGLPRKNHQPSQQILLPPAEGNLNSGGSFLSLLVELKFSCFPGF